MQPPGLFEEQALIRGDRPLAAENMIERRHIGALRAALHRLIELLWIADQDDRFSRLRYGKHVGERHLRGFVCEENVDRLERVLPRPQPCRAAADRGGAAAQCREQVLIILSEGKAVLWVFDLIGLLTALEVDLHLSAVEDRRIDQVADDLVTVGRDSDYLAAAHQLANHLRASEGLARTGRSLGSGERRPPGGRRAARGFNRRLYRAVQRLIADPRLRAGDRAPPDMAHRRVRRGRRHSHPSAPAPRPSLGRQRSCGRTRPADGGQRCLVVS